MKAVQGSERSNEAGGSSAENPAGSPSATKKGSRTWRV